MFANMIPIVFQFGGEVKWWDDDVSDPVCSQVWRMIKDTATNNTRALESTYTYLSSMNILRPHLSLYHIDAFDDRPWNEMTTLHVARAGLGLSKGSVALVDVPSEQAGNEKGDKGTAWIRMAKDNESVREAVKDVRGRLVLFPHQFLHAEHLEPDIATRLLIGKNLFL